MNILAVDTSSKKLCLGLSNHKGNIIEYNLDSGIRHAELLLPTIRKALRHLQLSLEKIDYFAVGLGPGSFTGLRIGLSLIKGFALALKKPVIGLPDLDVIASNAISTNSKVICPLVDAKRNLIFTALYEVGSNDKLKRKSPYLLINIEDLLKRLKSYKLVTFLGDGLYVYQQRLNQRVKKSIFLNEDTWYPRARNLIELASELFEKGKISQPSKIKPIYLYPKECQIKDAESRR